ncbi:MAG: hypothetical protein J6B22_07110 [Clostridia bacterium]|nr:hypothetical protein [Clostridia bacterium]
MAIGFRKSLFGYNQDDVIEYIKKLHNNFKDKEQTFKDDISALEEKVNALVGNEEKLNHENRELNAKLDEFNAKKAEMERLSENIGKLYLVANTNANTIMSNAEESSKLAESEINKNVSAIEETHIALNSLRDSVNETAQNFTNEISALIESLEDTKSKISNSALESKNASNEFSSLLEMVSK